MMAMKRTYSLPEETVKEFECLVPSGERSAVIRHLVDGWLQQRAKLRQDIIEGCREMADVYLEIEREFHPLEEEIERRSWDGGDSQ